mmetsp:Transcript_22719/g.70562  ORF Transcript_22719/g.70562 Transcript_22719/m.70562 type:complete len:204 (+) Transcript_22719:177-788(+)
MSLRELIDKCEATFELRLPARDGREKVRGGHQIEVPTHHVGAPCLGLGWDLGEHRFDRRAPELLVYAYVLGRRLPKKPLGGVGPIAHEADVLEYCHAAAEVAEGGLGERGAILEHRVINLTRPFRRGPLCQHAREVPSFREVPAGAPLHVPGHPHLRAREPGGHGPCEHGVLGRGGGHNDVAELLPPQYRPQLLHALLRGSHR